MATNIPPHNLGELCDAVIMLIDIPPRRCGADDGAPGPDFPTYGLILGTQGSRSAFETGRGSVIMQGKTHIEPMDRRARTPSSSPSFPTR
jgi:DNA gyrase subunit A